VRIIEIRIVSWFSIYIGMGGFIQRWHHMLSTIIPPDTMAGLHTNMLWDGLFHALTWGVTLVGIFMLWNVTSRHAERVTELPSTKSFVGSLSLGWGLFNLIEGVIDHHLLALHNVREIPEPLSWNIGFLLVGGGLLTLVGWALVRGEVRPRQPSSERAYPDRQLSSRSPLQLCSE
jgi:uncharacterized membrane protein